LYDILERAWWRGEIHGDEKFDRLQLLKAMFKTTRRSDHPGIVFIVCGETAPPEEKALPDGGVEVDLRPRIPVPSIDTDTWDIANCKDAFGALAQTSSFESYTAAAPGLMTIELTRDEFIRWLEERGYHTPSFWSAKTTSYLPVVMKSRRAKRRQGARAKYDWEDIESFVRKQLDDRGDFDDPKDQTVDWNSQNCLVRRVQEYCGRRGKDSPSDSVIKQRLPSMVDRWREATGRDTRRSRSSTPV
jgi:hypothetical protein